MPTQEELDQLHEDTVTQLEGYGLNNSIAVFLADEVIKVAVIEADTVIMANNNKNRIDALEIHTTVYGTGSAPARQPSISRDTSQGLGKARPGGTSR